MVQDDLREQQLAAQLRLERSASRTGSDARDEFENRYELKTVTTASVTTGRDVGLPYLQRLRRSYLICAKGENTEYGFRIEAIYFLSPEMMEDWIGGIESRLIGDDTLVESAIAALQQIGFPGDLTRLRQLSVRGLTINNPHISWAYIRSHGVLLQGEPALHLRQLVRSHPIPAAADLPPG